MRRAAVSLSILLAFAAAAPVDAQIVGRRTYETAPARDLFLPDSRLPDPDIWREVAQIRRNIHRAREGGLLSRHEARRLDREARLVGAQALRYRRDGLSESERAELAARATYIRQAAAAPAAARAGR